MDEDDDDVIIISPERKPTIRLDVEVIILSPDKKSNPCSPVKKLTSKKSAAAAVKKEPKVPKTRNVKTGTFDAEAGQSNVKKEDISNVKAKVKRQSKKRPNVDDIDVDEDYEDGVKYEVSVLETSRKWLTEDLVAEQAGINVYAVRNVISLLDSDCTIPFIARYRREMTGGMDAEKLRDVQSSYVGVKEVVRRADNVAKTLLREGKLEPGLEMALSDAKSLAEIEHLYAPFKSGSKRSLAEKARSLGLGEGALSILSGKCTLTTVRPRDFVQPETKGIASEMEVVLGFQHVAADVMAHDTDVLNFIRNLCHTDRDVVITSKGKKDGKENSDKFLTYFDFRQSVAAIKPHQVLALNRGEAQKALMVKVDIPVSVRQKTFDLCLRKWSPAGRDQETVAFLKRTADDAYSRLLEPLMCRHIRSNLTKSAEKESIKVFCDNLKHLLLTPPVRGRVVMGIDPGFAHGCKVAVVSTTGNVLTTEVLYIHGKKGNTFAADSLRRILAQFSCETIALGNGTACRETETFLSNLIKCRFFSPLSPQYCIVNESGASIYSVTKEAEEELPGMDPNLRSAVSLARRLQDPLLEYVKVEAKHIGVGMYQHDISEGNLKSALDGVAVDCVSFVGVDLNVASDVVLRRIAGLTATRAKEIATWRQMNGPFRNRHQLLLVKGLGPKSFEQCAGFVKILPQTSSQTSSSVPEVAVTVAKGRKKRKVQVREDPNPLDATTVHPESYDLAARLLKHVDAKVEQVGEASTIQKVERCLLTQSLDKLAEDFGTSRHTLQQIFDALKQPLEYDLRSEFERPLFRQGIASIDELKLGQSLTGRVTNCTHFGAFIDIGVGCDGLLHSSRMGGRRVTLGDRVSVFVDSLDKERKRIGLRLDHGSGPTKCKVANEVRPNSVVDGRVTNVAIYGVFVDVGGKRPGLLHKSQMGGRSFAKGDRIRVRILAVDTKNDRISMQLV